MTPNSMSASQGVCQENGCLCVEVIQGVQDARTISLSAATPAAGQGQGVHGSMYVASLLVTQQGEASLASTV